MSMIAVVTAACFSERAAPRGGDSRRGAFAFYYGTSLSEEQLRWYSRFDLLVTHDPLPPDQRNRLHAAGTRLVLYEWSVAFYDSRATGWQRSLSKEALLNQTPLTGGAGAATAGAWYYDPESRQHQLDRASQIARHIKEVGYDGVFFDTTTIENVHPEARKEYERRHPEVPYDRAFSHFLSQLRQTLPGGIIFTNQGYRSAESYLPFANWDLTESLITWPRNGAYELRPWNDPDDPWNSILFLMRNVIEPNAARHPRVRFGHLNYISAPSPETIRLVVAIAQLCGGEGYVAAPSPRDEADPVYFRNLGKPTSALLHRDDAIAYRFFEHGLVAVTAAVKEMAIDNPAATGLRNRFTRELICGRSITFPAVADGKPRAYFFDTTPDCGDSRSAQ